MNIRLGRKEIENLCKICNRFEDIDFFDLRQNSTGIGMSTSVRIVKEEEEEFPTVIEMDITDYKKW